MHETRTVGGMSYCSRLSMEGLQAQLSSIRRCCIASGRFGIRVERHLEHQLRLLLE